MKCKPCANNECEGKHEYHHLCKKLVNGEDCSCYCRRTKGDVAATTIISMELGTLAILGKKNCKKISQLNFLIANLNL